MANQTATMTTAVKSFLDSARRLWRGAREGAGQFARELAEDASGPSSRGRQRPPEQLPEQERPRIMEQYQRDFNERTRDLAERVAGGDISIREWRAQMTVEIRNLHVSAHVAGAGGFGALTQDDLDAIDRKTREQFVYLDRWAGQMQIQQALNENQLANRARLYGESSSSSFEAGKLSSVGIKQSLPQLPGDGQTRCRTNCKCFLDIQQVEGGFDVYWKLREAEHCPDCTRLARTWNPLRIRDGRVLPVGKFDAHANMHLIGAQT